MEAFFALGIRLKFDPYVDGKSSVSGARTINEANHAAGNRELGGCRFRVISEDNVATLYIEDSVARTGSESRHQ